MVDAVEVVEEEQSYEDGFDEMWADPDKGADLKAVPVVEEEVELVADPVETPVETPEVEAVATVERPAVTARDPYAWIDGLPEEQREMARSLKHQALSDRGRVSALTNKVNEISGKLDRSRLPPVPAATEEVAGTTAHTPNEKLTRLQEDYPELGKQLTDIFAEEAATLKQEVSDQITPIQEARTADAVASEQARMEQEASDIFNTTETGTHWKEVVTSEDFTAWLNMQPQFLQTIARTSENAQDGIDVLRMYEDDYQAAIAHQNAPPTDDTVQSTTSRGDALQAERQQRQATTVSPGSKHSGTDTDGVAGDYESQFNAMWGGKKK